MFARPTYASPDYAWGDLTSWNGAGQLLTTAEEARVTLTAGTVDLGTIGNRDVILAIDPSPGTPIDTLLAFVASGGHLILADDIGTTDPLLARLGVARLPSPPPTHSARWEGQSALPLITPSRPHFLFYNVREIVLNHPQALLLLPPPADSLLGERSSLLAYQGGSTHVILEIRYGSGTFLLLADPSIFLNDMIRHFYGDKQLIANALRVYCNREPCLTRFVGPTTSFTGTFDPTRARLGDASRRVEAWVDATNRALATTVNPWLARPLWLLTLLGLALLVPLAAWSWRRPNPLNLPAPPPSFGAPATSRWAPLIRHPRHADFTAKARTLVDAAIALGQRARFDDTPPHDPPDAQAWLRIRADVASLDPAHRVSCPVERFLRIADDAARIESAARASLSRLKAPPP